MADPIAECLSSVHECASSLDREFLNLAKAINQAEPDAARDVLQGVTRALHRLAEAAKPIAAACPACHPADGKGEYQAVNEFSGVWSRPECPHCRDLTQFIKAVDQVARTPQTPEKS